MIRQFRNTAQSASTSVPQSQRGLLDQLDGEQWLQRRIALHGIDVFAGDTNQALRKQRFRDAIKQHGLEAVICGSRESRPVTYAQAFRRLYGEDL